MGLPALAIGWAAWQGTGMAEAGKFWRDGPMPSYPPAEALAALDRMLTMPAADFVVLPANDQALLNRGDWDHAK